MRLLLFSLLALSASAFADSEGIEVANSKSAFARAQVPARSARTTNNQKQSMKSSMTLASGRPVAGKGWFFSLQPLYWYTSVMGEVAPFEIQGTDEIFHGKHDFPWAWGAQAAVGINMGHDQWDSQLLYTGFWPDSKHSSSQNGAIVDSISGSDKKYDCVQSNMSISYNMFDAELGKWFLFSKNIRVRPYTGIKAGSINQRSSAQFSSAALGANSATENSRSNFAGVGSEGGIRTQWNLLSRDIHSFSLLGDFSAALMYGHWSNRQSGQYLNGSSSSKTSIDYTGIDSSGLALMASGGVGFAWDVAIKDGDSHFAMDLTYQFQYWPSLSQLNAGITVPADLSFQGLGLKFRYDF